MAMIDLSRERRSADAERPKSGASGQRSTSNHSHEAIQDQNTTGAASNRTIPKGP